MKMSCCSKTFPYLSLFRPTLMILMRTCARWAPLETCGSPPSSPSRSNRRQQNPVILATRNQWFFHFDCFNVPFKQAVNGTLADQSWYTQEIHLKVCMFHSCKISILLHKAKPLNQILPEEKLGCQIGFWIRCLLKTEDNANTCPHKTLKNPLLEPCSAANITTIRHFDISVNSLVTTAPFPMHLRYPQRPLQKLPWSGISLFRVAHHSSYSCISDIPEDH